MHFDFHTMPGIDGLLSDFDAEDFAARLADAGVEYINFPARCNIGFSYYNTRIGKKYPGLERDILAEVVKACHSRDIGVSAYINVGLNHELSTENYGWCRIDRQGRVYKEDKVNNFFRTMCLNSDYREYVYSEIRELLEYDVDGIFCDCIVTRECYCPRCVRKMREAGVDMTKNEAVIAFQENVIFNEVYREIKDIVGEGRYLYLNSNRSFPGIHTHAEVECLPSSQHWGSDFFYPAASFQRTRFDTLVYMTGRFQDCWGDFGGLKPVESMQNDLYDALVMGYGLSISDHLHPVHGLEKEVISRVKTVFDEKKKYEKFNTGTVPLTEVGILAAETDYSAPEYLRGAARMLCELKIPYNTYTPTGDFSSERLMIIPKALKLSEELSVKLRDFCEGGGKLLFMGEGNDIALQLGLTEGVGAIKPDASDNAYFVLPGSDMQWAMYSPSRILESDGATELAGYVSGYFNLEFDGLHTYYYRPQKERTEASAALTNGRCAYIAYDAFDAYASNFLKENKLLVLSAINSLLPDRELLTEGLPSTAIVGLSGNTDSRIVHIKATYPSIRNGRGIVEDHAVIPRAKISLRGRWSRVKRLPELSEIPVSYEGERTVFEALDTVGYASYLVSE